MGFARRGQSFLALIFLIGVIVVAAGVTLSFLTTSFINSIYGYRSAARAQAVAASGAEDALLRLARNADFSDASGYDVAVGTDSATVTVTQSSTAGFSTILSTATVGNSTKKVSVVVTADAATAAVNIFSWTNVQ